MGHHIMLKNRSGEYERHDVSEPIYVYIKQLENYIKNPDRSKLKERYKDKFKDK